MSTSTSIHAPAEVPAEAPGSLFARVGQVFFSPGKLFEGFQTTAPWAGALLTVAFTVLLVALAGFVLIDDQVFADYMKEQFIAQGATQLPPDEQLLSMARINKMIGVIAGPILTTIVIFFCALVSWLTFSVIGGGKARYPQYLAVITHTMFISLLGAIVLFPLQVSTGQLEMELSLSLVADRFAEMNQAGVAYAVLKKIEIFNIWTMAVAGIGVAAINRKRGWIGYAALLFVIYVIFAVGIPQLLQLIFAPGQGA